MNGSCVSGTTVTVPMSEEEWKKQQEIRNKPFAELTTEQQIQRLRESARSIKYLGAQVNKIEGMVNKLYNHTHVDGKVVADIKSSDLMGSISSCGSIMKDPLD